MICTCLRDLFAVDLHKILKVPNVRPTFCSLLRFAEVGMKLDLLVHLCLVAGVGTILRWDLFWGRIGARLTNG